jgi:hypothetical protein
LAQTAPYRDPVGWLRCFRGIGTLSAMVLLEALEPTISARELTAYLGRRDDSSKASLAAYRPI